MSPTATSSSPIVNSFANALRAVKHRVEDMTFRERIVTNDFGGNQFKVLLADKTAALWYGAGTERPREFDLLKGRGLQPGAFVLDVGAHQAVVAMMMGAEVAPGGRVVAVEATERNAEVGRRNVALNGMTNVEILHAAAARIDGPISFSQRRNGMIASGDNNYAVKTVDGLSIDTLAARFGAPDLVYVDIEGYELEALRGAPRTLASKASWFLEVHGDADIGQFGGCNADVPAMFDESFDLFWSPDNAKVGFMPFARGAEPPHDRFFLVAIKKS